MKPKLVEDVERHAEHVCLRILHHAAIRGAQEPQIHLLSQVLCALRMAKLVKEVAVQQSSELAKCQLREGALALFDLLGNSTFHTYRVPAARKSEYTKDGRACTHFPVNRPTIPREGARNTAA